MVQGRLHAVVMPRTFILWFSCLLPLPAYSLAGRLPPTLSRLASRAAAVPTLSRTRQARPRASPGEPGSLGAVVVQQDLACCCCLYHASSPAAVRFRPCLLRGRTPQLTPHHHLHPAPPSLQPRGYHHFRPHGGICLPAYAAILTGAIQRLAPRCTAQHPVHQVLRISTRRAAGKPHPLGHTAGTHGHPTRQLLLVGSRGPVYLVGSAARHLCTTPLSIFHFPALPPSFRLSTP